MYKANELEFYVEIEDFGYPVVFLRNINGEPDENIGLHNVDIVALKKANLNELEEFEGCFSFVDTSLSIEEYNKLMIDAGFIQ